MEPICIYMNPFFSHFIYYKFKRVYSLDILQIKISMIIKYILFTVDRFDWISSSIFWNISLKISVSLILNILNAFKRMIKFYRTNANIK